jgi:hypothetical protein
MQASSFCKDRIPAAALTVSHPPATMLCCACYPTFCRSLLLMLVQLVRVPSQQQQQKS